MESRETTIENIDLNDFLGLDPDDQAIGHEFIPEPPEELAAFTESENLKTKIAGYYVNKQLEESLLSYGKIPEGLSETTIGVGFIDIVDYSYLSNWLSPKENQIFLNGLYTAFHLVLRKRGGFLNKISGDSMMFHFGGTIDPMTCSLPPDQAEPLIARLLFLTCIEIQETCRLFNRADEDFIPKNADERSRKALIQAFSIIGNLRENLSMVSSIDAMVQVRIRIGAALGEVCIGNFGPEGARQWDVIGVPVIEARRMESTAPVDGIRITKTLLETLEQTGLLEQFLEHFRGKASGFYQTITKNELFSRREVVLHDKRNATFNSCAVQANPDLPEDVWREVESLLDRHEGGAEGIIDLLKYYRGNRLVTHAIEEIFREREIVIRKSSIYNFLLPGRFRKMVEGAGNDERSVRERLDASLSLYQLFLVMGKFQDALKSKPCCTGDASPFGDHDSWLSERLGAIAKRYRNNRKEREQYRYFEEVLFPGVFASIEASVREYMTMRKIPV